MSEEKLPKKEEKEIKEEVAQSTDEKESTQEKQPTAEKKEETPEAPVETSTETVELSVSEESDTPKEEVAQTDEDEEHEEDEVASSDDEEDDEEHEEVNYHDLSKKELISAFKKILKEQPIQSIKKAVEEIRTEFQAKFSEEEEQQKEAFLEGGGNIIDFHYTTPLKKEFSSLLFEYREKRNQYYRNLKRDLQSNLEKRLELIEELKGLLTVEENINTTYKHFKDIQDRWHTAGAIPRDKYNLVWNTYRHHVENFYDFLHLNREFRDLDFKHNLDEKLKLIGRAEELAQEKDISKAFRELQMLHKLWKEDVGPVAKEYREEVWEKFSEATKVIHEKRQEYLEKQDEIFEENYKAKMDLVNSIKEVTQNTKSNHNAWQNAIKKVQELRDQYFEAGKVPRTKNKEIWEAFKEATRTFNRTKNKFYKEQKKKQYTNLEQKRELVKIAEENKDSEDFETVTPLMKKIQQDWKSIGHVPRKDSDKIWKQFKKACNHYFDRLHAERNEANKEEVAHLEAKEALLKEVSEMELSGEKEKDLALLKEKISEWKKIGRVPFRKKRIDQKFNKVLDEHFKKLKLSQKEAELIRFENKLNALVSQEDERKLQNEQYFISKKIQEVKSEIRQLENNLGFFQHVEKDNPLVKEVYKNIARHKEELEVWKAKMKKLKSL
tara:strand:+ start:76 stop:2070 length:1995 start_codon:yes stop_codon:yes gene_type:complete